MSAERLKAVQEALHKVQEQAAALEELGEQLSLSVHVLEAEVAALGRAPAEEAPLPASPRSADEEGARLVALNMALAGEPRQTTERYLGEHYEIDNPERLLDDVYAVAEGAR